MFKLDVFSQKTLSRIQLVIPKESMYSIDS